MHTEESTLASSSIASAYESVTAQPRPPAVHLGRTTENGIAPSMFGLLERGVGKRPAVAAGLRGRVVFRFEEDFAPVRVSFRARSALAHVARRRVRIEGDRRF